MQDGFVTLSKCLTEPDKFGTSFRTLTSKLVIKGTFNDQRATLLTIFSITSLRIGPEYSPIF